MSSESIKEPPKKPVLNFSLKPKVPLSTPYDQENWCELHPIKMCLEMKPLNLTLIGQAIAGCRSSIVVPEFGMVFDYGINMLVGTYQEMVAITHGHADHMGALHFHAFERRMHRMSDPTYLMPSQCVTHFHDAYDAYKKLNRHGRMFLSKTYKIEPINQKTTEDQVIHTPKGRYFVKAFKTEHTVPSVGYVVYDQRKKLLPEYQGLDGKEIGKLVKGGTNVSKTIEYPIFGYTGDTKIEGILNNPEFLEAKVLMTESSYIGLDEDDSMEKCRKRGHIHLDEIKANCDKFKNEYLVLCHFSRRYSEEEIRSKVEEANLYFKDNQRRDDDVNPITQIIAFI